MKPIASVLRALNGLVGTKDLNGWEDSFVRSVVEAAGPNFDTTPLSEGRVEKIEQIYLKHFSGAERGNSGG